MTKYKLNMIAWQALPTVKGDCPFKQQQKAWRREQMVKRMINYLSVIYS